jgi:3-oxoacyl-[acyl-carrier-protein] synthase II
MQRRIVVTGLGVISPVGIGKEDFWNALVQGKSGIGPITLFRTDGFQVNFGGEVKDFVPQKYIQQRKSLKVMARDIQLAVSAAALAVTDANLDTTAVDPSRFGVSFGAGLISTSIEELGPAIRNSTDQKGEFDIRRFGQEGMQTLFPLWLLKYLPNMLACHISINYNAQGPNNTITTAGCASTQAIGEAFRVIQRDDADIVLAGGSDSKINPLSLLRYELLNLLSHRKDDPTKASRPFDRDRDGFVIGEGSGVIVMEELEHAERRGAKIYAELVGYGTACDGNGVLDLNSDGRGLVHCMSEALSESGLDSSQIGYINAHGISDLKKDRIETLAIKKVFGAQAKNVAVSSIKSMIGHLGAGAGVVECIASLMSLQEGVLPPTINYENSDPECDLDYVPNTARKKPIEALLSNSYSIGGQSACLAMKRWDD